MAENPSIGVTFFGLSAKEHSLFKRVLTFMAKKGIPFHQCDASSARLFVINDESTALEQAIQQQNQHVFLMLSDQGQCAIGDYQLKRPLLLSRVMSALEQCSTLCNKSVGTTTHNLIVKKSLKQQDKHLSKTTFKAKPKTSISISNKTESKASIAVTPSNTNSNLNRVILERAKQARLAKDTPNPIASRPLQDKQGDFQALVVDDSAAIRKQLEIELRPTSIQADYAVCGEDALEKLTEKQYDLIFLDIIMPGIDGYEVCKTLRKMPNYKRTPVIMLSGKVGPLDEVEGILAGASTYLLKPVQHQHFQETLTRISKWLSNFA